MQFGNFSILKVEQDVKYWEENSDIGRTFFQTKDFELSNDLIICNEKNIISCISFLWDYIHIYARRLNDGSDHRTLMIIFPYCEAVYTYDTMEKWFDSVKKSSELCSVFGKKFQVSQFHPTYKNEPKMLSLIRHSPFPSFALHEKSKESLARKELTWIEDKTQIDYIFGKDFDNDGTSTTGVNRMKRGKKSENTEENVDSLFHEYIDQRRNDFEALFNSGAALSPLEGRFDAGLYRNQDNLEKNKYTENNYSDDDVITMTKDWMLKRQKDKEEKKNMALEYSGSVSSNEWIVTNSTSEENLYSEIWRTVDRLQRNYDESPRIEGSVICTVLITKRYSIFNANQYKRFAVSVNGILKEFTNGNSFLELFHPEFVGKKSSRSSARRSPFPTLQICYRRLPS